MKRLLSILTALLLPFVSLAEMPEPGVTILFDNAHIETQPLHITDEGFIRWLEPLLAADDPCTKPVELMPAHHRFLVTFTDESGVQTQYGLWHDTLYEHALVTHPDGTMHHITPDVPALLCQAVQDTVRFTIPEEHRALLEANGWTPIYRVPMLFTELPKTLESSRTDAASLYFTWANLFLEHSGYDLTPWLGRAVTPCVYQVYERENRVAWCPEDAALLDENGECGVENSMQAVILTCDGRVIGAYMRAYSFSASNLMTLDRRTSIDLLGDTTIREYLLSKLPITEEERALAALEPEEIIRRYAAMNDPQLTPIDVTLNKLSALNAPILFPRLSPVPRGTQALEVRPHPKASGFWQVFGADWRYYPELVLESPETGWKIVHFYNTGI